MSITIGLHYHDEPNPECRFSWAQALDGGRPVSAIQLQGVTIFFEKTDQIDALGAVLAEARNGLVALSKPQPVAQILEEVEDLIERDEPAGPAAYQGDGVFAENH
jgi:hypothetical protein